MTRTEYQNRQHAIESGVHNAVDTVVVDKAMTADEARESLESFVVSALAGAGLDDTVSAAEMAAARQQFPL